MREKESALPTCRLCGSLMDKQLAEEERQGVSYHVAVCSRCDLVQAVEHVASVSPDYVDLGDSALDADRIWCQSAHKLPAFCQWLSVSQRYLTKPGARLLDIGCGTGGFLRFASDAGFEVFGFDASQAQAQYAASDFVNVRCSTSLSAYLRDMNQPDLKFDYITLWDVFEHIRDPLKLLGDIKSTLSPSGLLFLSIPNGGAFRWKVPLYKAVHRHLDFSPWEHVFYYSPRSLALCMEKAGMHLCEHGAVACYPRRMSLFEFCRRVGFACFRSVPGAAPQIFAVAKAN